MQTVENGCVNIWIDEVVPCLKDNETGEIKETFVFRVESKACIKTSYLGCLHPYQFMLGIAAAQKLLEVYTYEWN